MWDKGIQISRRHLLKRAAQAGAVMAAPYIIPGAALGMRPGE